MKSYIEFAKEFKRSNFFIEEGKITEWESYVNSIPMLKSGVDLLKEIEKIGADAGMSDPRAYIVGGTVRDIIIGENEPDDIDVATNVSIELLEPHFNSHDIGKNKDFGILVIEKDGFEFEIANFRKDGEYSNGRQPDTVEIVTDYKDDASRRDLTINAMAVDDEGNIIDYFDGQKDIKNKIIRTVGDAHKRFDEDYIRMLRAIRFGSRLGFDIDSDTMQAIKDNAGKLEGQAKERIMKEIYKMAKQDGSKFADAVITLKDSGLLQYILPEVVEMDEFEHDADTHPEGNVFEHVMAALRNSGSDDAIVNLATLLHDVGKIDTHSLDEKGKHKYFAHAKRGGEMIDDIAKRLKLSKKDKEALQFAAINHMKMHDLVKMKPSKIMKLINNENWDVLEKVALADSKARGELFSQEEWDTTTSKIQAVRDKFKGENDIAKIKKVLSGKVIMDVLGMTKGTPEVGRINRELVDWAVNENIDITDGELIKSKIKELAGKSES